MSKHNDQSTFASYAQALLELSDARGVTGQVDADFRAIVEAVGADATLRQYLTDPSVGHAERDALLDRVFGGGRTPDVLVSFLKVLSSKGRLGLLAGIGQALKSLLDARAGNVDVGVTVAKPLNDDELNNVRSRVSEKLGKNAVITQTIDESIIGGLILKMGDTLIDGSVKTQLETMKKRLVAAV